MERPAHRPLVLLLLAAALSGPVSARAAARLPELTSTIGFPLANLHVAAGTPITLSGEAAGSTPDIRVEVSTDGGATWRVAEGGERWSLPWTPDGTGPVSILARAFDEKGVVEAPGASVTVTIVPPRLAACPCSLWPPSTVPGITDDNASIPIEVGVRFRSDEDGTIAAIRFYKMGDQCGPHSVHLWTHNGMLLAGAEGTSACTNGWHEIAFPAPVAIERDSEYVASVHMPRAHYSLWSSMFYASGVDRPPLHAPIDRPEAGNGLYSYGTESSFPDSSFISSNYWVDVRFETPGKSDDAGPLVLGVAPGDGARTARIPAAVSIDFDEAIDPATLGDSSFVLRDDAGDPVRAVVRWDPAARRAVLEPTALAYARRYHARLTGAVRDLAGNPVAPLAWTFTTEPAPASPSDEGPGGPILLLASTANPFTRYLAEILRAEGLNAFRVRELEALDPVALGDCEVAILGDAPVPPVQVNLLTHWVEGGGRLVVSRPHPELAGLCGLDSLLGSRRDAYLAVDTGEPPGRGIAEESMQYHGSADLWSLVPGTRVVASLWSDASTPTVYPAVAWRDVGAGAVAAFTYDLARSVVLTRQGNPAWSGQEREGSSPLRSVDLFIGAAPGDPQPDWVDFSRIQVPQADEQQRLLANVIAAMTSNLAPIPRFGYLPRGLKAAIVMTGDAHGSDKVAPRFDLFAAASDSGCAVDDWECVRATTYLYSGPPLTDAEARAYVDQGFDVAVHLTARCLDVPRDALGSAFDEQLGLFAQTYPSLPAPTSNRTHCAQWGDFSFEAELEAERGIRLDTNYYYFPPWWIEDRPGLFTGSGLPMRFARADGSVIDCWQAATQFTDDAHMSIPHNVDVVLENALGPRGFYGAFVCNVHHEVDSDHVANDILASAKAHGVPVISAQQLLTWSEGRAASTVRDLTWGGNVLAFTVDAAPGARGLSALLPRLSASGDTLGTITRDGEPVPFVLETLKGVEVARFDAPGGTYVASWFDRTVGVTVPGLAFSFARPAPSPSRGPVRFAYTLSAAAPVRLAIYGIRGNLVRTLVRGPRAEGPGAATWDLRDDRGCAVGPGIYLARCEAGGRAETRRVVILH